MVPEGKEPKITGSVLYTTVNSIWGWKDEFRMPHTYLLTIKGQNKKKKAFTLEDITKIWEKMMTFLILRLLKVKFSSSSLHFKNAPLYLANKWLYSVRNHHLSGVLYPCGIINNLRIQQETRYFSQKTYIFKKKRHIFLASNAATTNDVHTQGSRCVWSMWGEC
jgi:hypothetical protein